MSFYHCSVFRGCPGWLSRLSFPRRLLIRSSQPSRPHNRQAGNLGARLKTHSSGEKSKKCNHCDFVAFPAFFSPPSAVCCLRLGVVPATFPTGACTHTPAQGSSETLSSQKQLRIEQLKRENLTRTHRPRAPVQSARNIVSPETIEQRTADRGKI